MIIGNIIQRFDPNLRFADISLKQAIADFAVYLETQETGAAKRKRGRKTEDRQRFHLAIEALLGNLMATNTRSPRALLNVPLANNVLRGNPRYRPAVYGKHFRDLIGLMEELRLINMVTKGHNVRSWKRRGITTIRPTAKLLKAFPFAATMGDAVFTRVEPAEVIVLKSKDGKLADYAETDDTERWRGEIRAINVFLSAASISIVPKRNILDESGFVVRPNMRTLRRIWNNETWAEGGRLYDGFWQTMKREERLASIRINNERIANVDFRQFNLRLAYTMADINPPSGDLYDVTGKDTLRPDWALLREGRKKLVNAMINRRTPLTAWPGATPQERKALAACFPEGTTARIATTEIRSRHAPVADYLENGWGLRFMRIESDILLASLLRLIERDITALPLHDAVLVSERHVAIVKIILEQEAERRIGTPLPVGITTLGGEIIHEIGTAVYVSSNAKAAPGGVPQG